MNSTDDNILNGNSAAELKSCGFLVFRDEPRRSFLLMRHADRWDLPKGHVDSGESEMETALRELEEETGYSPDLLTIDRDFRFSHEYTVRARRNNFQPVQKELVIFLATLVRPAEPVPSEHQGYRWFDWSPPHRIQPRTIDPLLQAVAGHWSPDRAARQ